MPTATKLGTWIYERTGPSGGSGGGAGQEPPPVTILDTSIEEKEDGQIEVAVYWEKDAAATPENFTGCKVYLEDPDVSEKATAPLNGTVTFGQQGASGTPTSVVSGAWKPIPKTDSFESPAILLIPGKPVWRPIRVYLLSFNRTRVAKFTRANLPAPTPSIRVGVGAARNILVSGMENTWTVEDPLVTPVENFEDPNGPTFRLDFDFSPTYEGMAYETIPLPPGLKKFAGVQIVYEFPDGTRDQGPYLDVNKPEEWHSTDIPIAETQTLKCWFVSKDIEGNLNQIVKDVTPVQTVQVVYPPAGQGSTPDVTGFALANKRHATMIDGTLYALADASWTIPSSTRYSGVSIYRVGVDPPRLFGSFPAPTKGATLQINELPSISETWTFAAIAYNFDGKPTADPAGYPWTGKPEASRVPTATWVVGPPALGGTGQEHTGLGTAGTVETEQILSNDGVQMMRHKITGWSNPADNTFGGMSIARVASGDTVNATWWDAPKGATSFTTDWEPAPEARTWDFYFVSRSMDGKRNTILPGTTPRFTHPFTPIPGDIKVTRLPKDWFDESEFDWPEGEKFSAERFLAKKIYVGSILRVGGGPAPGTGSDGVANANKQFGGFQNGQVAVYNSSNTLRAWMGENLGTQTPDNPTAHTVFGGWFSELYIGGGSPVNAPLYATNAGVVIIGGFEYFQGQPYAPYISIRRNTGQEVGRIGARIARNTDGSTLVPNGDPADIAGAWFNEFAVGGSNLSDWRILARRDATNPTLGSDLVNIRNINKFTIDYLQNYNPSGSYPNNEAVHLEFGYDAFMVDNAAPSAWKFPGIKIQRSISGTPTTHGSMLITRGLILYGPSSQRKAALVSWNGDQNGNPDTASTWWGELSLYAPNANGTVLLTGGSASDVPLPGQPGSSLKPGQSPTGTASAAFFRMMNESAQTNFYVDQRGNVYCRGYCDVTETLTAKAISTAGFSLTGGGAFSLGSSNVTTTGTVQAGTLTVTGNATVSGNITCTGANPNGVIEARVLKGAHTSGSVDVSTVKASGAITGGSFNVGSTAALDTAGHYIGPQISTGQINGARIITDTAFAVKQFTPPFYKDVINSAGVFVGPSINTPGSIAGASLSISGATTFAGELGAGSFKAGTNVVINAAGAFVGKGVSCPSDGIGGLSLGIWTGSVYEYGINVPGTAPAGGPGNTTDTYLLTNDGKRARVRGGLVVEIL